MSCHVWVFLYHDEYNIQVLLLTSLYVFVLYEAHIRWCVNSVGTHLMWFLDSWMSDCVLIASGRSLEFLHWAECRSGGSWYPRMGAILLGGSHNEFERFNRHIVFLCDLGLIYLTICGGLPHPLVYAYEGRSLGSIRLRRSGKASSDWASLSSIVTVV